MGISYRVELAWVGACGFAKRPVLVKPLNAFQVASHPLIDLLVECLESDFGFAPVAASKPTADWITESVNDNQVLWLSVGPLRVGRRFDEPVAGILRLLVISGKISVLEGHLQSFGWSLAKADDRRLLN